jgi:hypothetical protein
MKKTTQLDPKTNDSITHWSWPNGNDILHIVQVFILTPHDEPFFITRLKTPQPIPQATFNLTHFG